MNLSSVKLDVCWFCYRSAGATPLLNLHEMLRYTKQQGVDVQMGMYGNALIHHSRNEAVSKLRQDCTHMLMVDDDMVCERDAVVRLLELEAPVATPITTNRKPPIHLIPHIWDGSLKRYCPITRMNLHQPVRGYFAIGAAFMLMDRATVDALVKDYLEAYDWMRDSGRMLDRMVVKWERREQERYRRAAIRQRRYEENKAVRIFNFPVDDEECELSEDFAIGDKLRALSIESVVDGRLRIGHVGEYPYGVWDMMYREELLSNIKDDYDFDPRQYMSPAVQRYFDEYLRQDHPKPKEIAA